EVKPDDPTARTRQAHSLTNAANAFYHARKFGDSEVRHREAIRILEDVTARHAQPDFHLQHVRSYAPLHEVFREQGRWADAEVLGGQYVRRAREVVDHISKLNVPDTVRHTADGLLANAMQSHAQTLDRTGKRDAGECYLLESLLVRERIVARTKGQP